ncbi:hypothetical protein [Photobacterium aquae]|uniref:hypothetical protein n=1 Tax=Photobacterium aquae TaxID=1195763 RepID=UPI000B0024C8|nr:hypothetical protein [Photobacterium aquae]
MQKIILTALLIIGTLTITGCQLTHIEGELDGVTIKASSNDNYGHGHFCPPGQAKKGNC